MTEIERKFIVEKDLWQPKSKGNSIKQGYLSTDPARTVRIRITEASAFLTIKGKTIGISRTELEYEIPKNEAEVLLKMCLDTPIIKTRYKEKIGAFVWEIDIFEDQNKGLILAEVELESEDQKIILPKWIKKEVSHDHRYFNSWLSKNPYSTW